MHHLWRGMANMAQTAGHEVVIVRGDGVTVWDADGNDYLDATASLWYANVGHGRREIADAVADQLATLEAFHTFDVYVTQPALDLAERISELAPMTDARIFLTPGGGSDAVDSAGKIARRYWAAVGQPGKAVICARTNAYHGMNAYGSSLSGIPPNQEGFGEMIPHVEIVGWDSVDEVRELFERSADTIAAFIGEPVIGAGGLHPPPEGYWPAIADLCREHDVLLIADEVISGFGRLGSWFGCQHYGFEPDLITVAKGLTSGYLPLGAVIASPRVAEPFWSGSEAPMFRHGYTYAGHPAACAAALANLAIIEREGLVQRVAELAPQFRQIIEEAFAGCPIAGPVRGAGLLAAVPVRADLLAHDPALPLKIAACARSHGLVVRGLSGAIQLSPPFVITVEQIAEVGSRLRAAFDEVGEREVDPARRVVPAGAPQ